MKSHPAQNLPEVFSIVEVVLGKTDKNTTVKTKQAKLKQWIERLTAHAVLRLLQLINSLARNIIDSYFD
jgi:hypothetical protein